MFVCLICLLVCVISWYSVWFVFSVCLFGIVCLFSVCLGTCLLVSFFWGGGGCLVDIGSLSSFLIYLIFLKVFCLGSFRLLWVFV